MTTNLCLPNAKLLTAFEIKTLNILSDAEQGLTRPQIYLLHRQGQAGLYKSITKFFENGFIERRKDPNGKKNSDVVFITNQGRKCLMCHQRWMSNEEVPYEEGKGPSCAIASL